MSPNNSTLSAEMAEKIALFRFSIIAPVLHDPKFQQTQYFKEMAQKVHDVPGLGHKKYRWKTFKSWLRTYRLEGFDGLKPQTRTDKGQSRIVKDDLEAVIRQKFDQFPALKIPLLYTLLAEEGYIRGGAPCENTLRNYVRTHHLKPATEGAKTARKKFEKAHVNQLWMSDFMHGQQLLIDGTKRKLFLGGIIDDHSRLLVGGRWSLSENAAALELILKDALATYGLPQMLYCDNGAVYVSHHLQLVCARLGIALIHSKPYDSPARGKIERFWRTVREGFLPLVDYTQNYSLERFNNLFEQWLDQGYHRKMHLGISSTPLDRYLDDVQQTPIRRIAENDLELLFYQTYTRTVKNDATVSVDSVLYEVPPKYIGAKVELRHPTGQPTELYLYENEKPVLKLHPVNPVQNSQSLFHGIRFAASQNPNEEDAAC